MVRRTDNALRTKSDNRRKKTDDVGQEKRKIRKKHRPLPRTRHTLDQIVDLVGETLPRREANKYLKRITSVLPDNLVEKYKILRRAEKFHITHVRRCMDTLVPEKKPCRHDYTKDELYQFLTVCAYGFKHDKAEDLLKVLQNDHWTSEPHHEEYEYLGGKITDLDVIECMIDRLSRNLQFNKGDYNRKDLEKYRPKYISKQEHRMRIYDYYMDKFSKTVKEIWQDMKRVEQ